MAETKIQWAATRLADGSFSPGYSFNPWRGCTKVSSGCKNCYAETLAKRNPQTLGEWGPNGIRAMAAESYWKLPLAWNRKAEKDGERKIVFCASLADVFEKRKDLDAPRSRLFELIGETPNLTWMLLTKRPENLAEMWPFPRNYAPPNIWLGVSVENQEMADKRIPELLKYSAPVRFLSCEPLLGQISLHHYLEAKWTAIDGKARLTNNVNYVITGGESGPHARVCHIEHIQYIVHQCGQYGIPCFVKQIGRYVDMGDGEIFCPKDKKGGDMTEWEHGIRVRQMPGRYLL